MRLAVVAVCALVGVAVAVEAWASPGESWVDSQYGWTSNEVPGCGPGDVVCATENGGASWHEIFESGGFIFGVVRTSRTAGVVTTGRQVSARFWTRDNGRHWFRTRRIGPEFQGSGRYLFWISIGGPKLHQVRPWPPRGRARCDGVWTDAAFETVPVTGGNVCSDPAVEAGMRSSVVATLQQGRFVGLSNIPGGIIATVDGGTPASPRVLLYRRGRATVVVLPPASGVTHCTGFNSEPIVTWPRITVLGCRGAGPATAVWLSKDGGASWTVIGP